MNVVFILLTIFLGIIAVGIVILIAQKKRNPLNKLIDDVVKEAIKERKKRAKAENEN